MFLNENGKEGKLIGQNMFMRTAIKADDRRNIPIMTMGPICIKNEYKRKGYGKSLLDYSFGESCRARLLVHYAWKEILNFLWEEWIQTGKRVWYPLSRIAGGLSG